MGVNPIKPAQLTRRLTDAEKVLRAAYLNDIAARNTVLAANENERVARHQAAAVDRQTAAIDELSRRLDRLASQTDLPKLKVPERAVATAAKLIKERRFDLTQEQFAHEVGCSVRHLRRNAMDGWLHYQEAAKRQPEVPANRGGRARRLKRKPSDD